MTDTAVLMELIPGVDVTLGRKIFVVPALNIKAMRLLRPQLGLIQKGTTGSEEDQDAYLDAVVKIATAALVRNYPEVNEDFVAENIDFGNMQSVVLALLGVSGFTADKAAPTQAATVGE